MNLQDFFRLVLPARGYLVGMSAAYADGKLHRPAHQAFENIESLVPWAAVENAAGKEVYFSYASYNEPRGTGQFKTPRNGANMCAGRVLTLDIDCHGGENEFATVEDALDCLDAWCHEHAAAPSVTVLSGGGVHVYWALEADVDGATMATYRRRLLAHLKATADPRLWSDPKRTTDRVGVLRVPGTFNRKQADTPVRVQLCRRTSLTTGERSQLVSLLPMLDDIGREQAGAAPNLSSLWGAPPSRPSWTLKSGTTDSLDGEGVSISALTSTCALAADFMAGGQAAQDRELWRLNAGVFHFAQLEDEYIEGASKSPNYGGADEQRRTLAQWAAMSGPPRCQTMADADVSGKCQQCPWLGSASNPLTLSRKASPAPALDIPEETIKMDGWVPVWPDDSLYSIENQFKHESLNNYRLRPDGIYRVNPDHADDEGASMTKVTEAHLQVLLPARWKGDTDSDIKTRVMLRASWPHLGRTPVELPMPASSHSKAEQIEAIYANRGIVSVNSNSKRRGNFRELTMDLFYYAVQYLPETPMISRYGWYGDDFDSFVAGPWMYRKGKAPMRVLGDNDDGGMPNEGQYAQKGSLEGWAECFNMYSRYFNSGVERQEKFSFPRVVMMASSFASPLMEICNTVGGEALGLIVNAWTPESGVGKSSVLRTMRGAWHAVGPKDYLSDGNATSTRRGMEVSRVKQGHLPYVFDELTKYGENDDNPQALAELCFSMTEQGARTVSSQTGAVVSRGKPSSSLLLATSNQSIEAKLSRYGKNQDAEGARAFDMFVPDDRPDENGLNGVDTEYLVDMHEQALSNYGYAGPAFIQYVMENMDEVKARLRHYVKYWRKEIVNEQASMRLVCSTIACLQVSLEILQKMGISEYDMSVFNRTVKGLMDEKTAKLSQRVLDSNPVTLWLGAKDCEKIMHSTGVVPVEMGTVKEAPASRGTNTYIQRHYGKGGGVSETMQILASKFEEFLTRVMRQEVSSVTEKLAAGAYDQAGVKVTAVRKERAEFAPGTPYSQFGAPIWVIERVFTE